MVASEVDRPRAELVRGALWSIPLLLILLISLRTMPSSSEDGKAAEGLLAPAGLRSQRAVAAAAAASNAPPSLPVPPTEDQWVGKRNIDSLLRGKWFALRTPRSMARTHSDLISLLRGPPAVSIINLWQPGCEPCKREFPEFRKLQAGWGREIRFMAVQLGTADPGGMLSLLPQTPLDILDIGPGQGTIHEQLVALGLVGKKVTIPLTMVLDCRHQLRWLRAREITDMDELAGIVKQLRDELGTPYCPAPSSPALEVVTGNASSVTPARSAPFCGDQRCESGENAGNCCIDCPCSGAQRCQPRANGRPICVISESGLQD